MTRLAINSETLRQLRRIHSPLCLALSDTAERGDGAYQDAEHLRVIDRALLRLIRGDSAPTLLIEAPPRHGKSQLVSKFLPAWFIGRWPNKRVILASYGDSLARGFGRDARDLLALRGGWFADAPRVRDDVSGQSDWRTNFGGGMVTAGIGGPLTGKGADLLIIDDPVKDAQEALSETSRQTAWDWFQSTATKRLEPGAKTIVMATRWHSDDLTGRIRSADGTKGRPLIKSETLTLRAIAEDPADDEPPDPIGRTAGQPLWPSRWPLDALLAVQEASEAYWWEAMYQQRLGQHGLSEWPPEYFAEPFIASDWPDAFDLSVLAIDPSKAKTKRSDMSGLIFVGLARGLLWVDARIERLNTPALVTATINEFLRHVPQVVAVEANAWQHLLADEFHRRQQSIAGTPPLPIVEINNTVPKEIRISRLGPFLMNHAFRFRPSSGVDTLVKQLRGFPHASHDDGPDALEMAVRTLNHLARGEVA